MGGHGGLNILPQKRWNVYNFDNREKVRRDEENAAKEQQEQEYQTRQRESEARLQTLRDIARTRKPADVDADVAAPKDVAAAVPKDIVVVPSTQIFSKHLNLFAELEAKEKEEDEKALKEQEKRKGREERADARKKLKRKEVEVDDERYMLAYGSTGKQKPWYMSKSNLLEEDDEQQREELLNRKKRNGEKTARKTIEELRAERMKRERNERSRAGKLTQVAGGGCNNLVSSRHYNSGFGNSQRS